MYCFDWLAWLLAGNELIGHMSGPQFLREPAEHGVRIKLKSRIVKLARAVTSHDGCIVVLPLPTYLMSWHVLKGCMIRFLVKFLATLSLAVAIVMAVLDATRTVAAKVLVITPLQASWTSAWPDGLAAFQSFLQTKIHPLAWDPITLAVLSLPGFVVFAGPGLSALRHRPQTTAQHRPFCHRQLKPMQPNVTKRRPSRISREAANAAASSPHPARDRSVLPSGRRRERKSHVLSERHAEQEAAFAEAR